MTAATTLELARQLIARASITPDDAGCQRLIAERLEPCGFAARHLRFGEVDNVWLSRGRGAPVFAFLGHTDVVPPGPAEAWHGDPFQPWERDGLLYGRGAADMKGSVAAMTMAMQRFVAAHPEHRGTVAMLLTSDEEGEAVNGARRVMENLRESGVAMDWCLVGEPCSRRRLGDVIKNGRRGSLNCRLTIRGRQGHTAYPQAADNPIHRLAPALLELTQTAWDPGNAHYPPGGLQVSNLRAGAGAANVIPGAATVEFNLRFSTARTEADLKAEIAALLERHGLDYECRWAEASQPFLSPGGELLAAVKAAIKNICRLDAETSTDGGTSDGRFVAPTGAEVVELGPVNASIHQPDEHVGIADLDALSAVYEAVLVELLG